MKQKVNLPLNSIYSLIRNMEDLADNPETAEQYKNIQDTLNLLKEAFMPLINKFNNCLCLPDIEAEFDTDSERTKEKHNEWEQKRFELIKSAMQGLLAATDPRYGYTSSNMESIAREAILMADILIEEINKSKV